jgi:SSS family solute:Na+ symporter
MTKIELILIGYLALVTGIGIYSFFKVKDAADYYISGKRGSWWQVSGSLFATIMGGSAILGTIELSQKAGWSAAWFLLSASAGLFVLSMISRKISLLGHYTLPELLLRFYGKKAEKAASLLIPIAWTGIIAAQIIAGAKILDSLDITSYRNGAWICGAIFVFYTLAGGQLSILKTDFVQALIILAGIITMFILRLNQPSIITKSAVPDFSLFNDAFTVADLLILLLTYSITFVVGPDIYSRIFCAKNEKVAQRSILTVAALLIPIAFILTYLGVMAGSQVANGSGFIIPGSSFLPTWALGLMAAALLSAVMSSADTTLLNSSMILSELFTGNLDKPGTIKLTRLFIVLMGLLSMFIALKVTSILNALLMSLTFFSGAFIIPIIAGLAGWPVKKDNVIMAIATGGGMALAGKILTDSTGQTEGYWLILAAFIINAAILLVGTRSLKSRP